MVFPLTPNTDSFKMDYPPQWCTETLKYLGIWITGDKDELLRANYGLAISMLTGQIARWMKVPLSLTAQIGVLKLGELPRFLYLLIKLPLALPSSFFAKLRVLAIKLVWAGKQVRIQ